MKTIESEPMQEIPTFAPDQIKQAAIMGVVAGVAKIAGLIDSDGTAAVNDSVNGTEDRLPFDKIIPLVPQLRPVYMALSARSQSKNAVPACATFDSLLQRAYGENAVDTSHTDNTSTTGVSVLFPVSGPKAVFAAAPVEFELSRRIFEDPRCDFTLPQYIGTYKPGDAVIIRQRIKRLNDRDVNLGQVHHIGAAGHTRMVMAMDIPILDLWLPEIDSEIIEQLT